VEAQNRIFQCIEDEDTTGVLDYLKGHRTVDLLKLRDDKGYTCLHSASFKNSEAMVKCLLSCARDITLQGKNEKAKNQAIKEWVNLPSRDEQFSALHMASFRGNFKIVEMLLENDASIHAINKDGLTMMHTSA
jgi:ankyrin repeat protein